MIKKNNRIKASSIFFIIIVVLTFYVIFKNNDINELLIDFRKIKWYSIVICVGLMFLYFYFQALYMKYVLKSLNNDIKTNKGIFYSILEFFFSAITPSSSGGQPMQLYYMSKDKIPLTKSAIVLLLNAIIFKLFFIFAGILILIFRFDLIATSKDSIKILFGLGLGVDVVVIIVCYLFMYNQSLIKKSINLFNKIFKKKSLNKDVQNEIDNKLNDYLEGSKYIKTHKKELLVAILITFIQRMCMCSILYVIYIGLGLNGLSFIDVISTQIIAQICIEGLLLPGGTGAIESISNELYKRGFGDYSLIGTLINRGMIFYIPVVISLIVIVIVTKKKYINNEKIEGNE